MAGRLGHLRGLATVIHEISGLALRRNRPTYFINAFQLTPKGPTVHLSIRFFQLKLSSTLIVLLRQSDYPLDTVEVFFSGILHFSLLLKGGIQFA